MKLVRNSFYLMGYGLLLAAVGLLLLSYRAHAQPSSLAIQQSAAATTTVSYLVINGTATYQFDSNGNFNTSKVPTMQPIDAVSLFIQYAASSTASTLTVTPQWSNNNVDWYGYNQTVINPGATGTSTLASSTLSYAFTALGTATSSQVINLPPVWAQHERVIFTETGAAGAVYNEVVLKRNPNSP